MIAINFDAARNSFTATNFAAGQYFVLDSNAAGFSAAEAALLGYTPAATVGDCDFDATLKIIRATVSEAQLDADGDLVNCRTANFPTELCRHRWTTADEFRAHGGPDMLGQTGRDYWVVRQKTRPATGTGDGSGYGEGTGRTYYDAADGCQDTSVFTLGTWPEGGATIDFCGSLHKSRVEQASGLDGDDTNGFIDFPVGDFSSAPLICRGDYEFDPCMITQLQDHDWLGGDKGNAWTQDGTEPNMWSRPTSSVDNTKKVLYMDPAQSAEDIMQNKGYLENVASIADCRSTEWSFFADGAGTLYVHIADGTDPRHRIAQNGDSSGLWNIGEAINDASTRSKGIKFIHMTFVDCGNLATNKTGEFEWRGCRFIAGTNYRPANGVGTSTYVGWSEDGAIPWDTSDIPDPSTDTYIAKAVAKGSSQTNWNKITRFSRFYGTTAGVYEAGGGFTDKAGFQIQGLIGEHVGEEPSWAAARNLGSGMFDNVDGHVIGQQGVSNLDASFIYVIRENEDQSGNPIEFFPINDTTSCQNIQNCSITDFVLRGGGISFSGAGLYKRRDGTGLLDGNVVRRGCIADNPIDADNNVFNGVEAGSYGISSTWTEQIEVDSVHFVDVGNCLGTENNAGGFTVCDMVQDGGEAQNPLRGLLTGVPLYYHDCTFEDWGTAPTYDGRIFHGRQGRYHESLDTIVSITKASPARVEVTGHGYPDFSTPAAGVYGHPEVYFDNMVGMTELDGQVYYAVWVDANHFDLYSAIDTDDGSALTPVDSSGYGTFTSGGCARAQIGGLKGVDNTFIKSGVSATNVDMYKYGNNNYTLEEYNSTTVPGLQQHLPGTSDAAYETNYSLNP